MVHREGAVNGFYSITQVLLPQKFILIIPLTSKDPRVNIYTYFSYGSFANNSWIPYPVGLLYLNYGPVILSKMIPCL